MHSHLKGGCWTAGPVQWSGLRHKIMEPTDTQDKIIQCAHFHTYVVISMMSPCHCSDVRPEMSFRPEGQQDQESHQDDIRHGVALV